MAKYITLLLIMIVLSINCSNQPTNDGMISLEEYDEGLNLKVSPVFSLVEGLRIEFSLPVSSSYVLTILNATGYTVKTFKGTASSGNTTITWNLTNDNDKPVTLGIYVYELVAGGFKSRVVTVVREEQ